LAVQSPDRILATLFTDLVGSTERALALGDRGWHELLEELNARLRELLARYDGRELDTAGDGFAVVSVARRAPGVLPLGARLAGGPVPR
jgi:class 3 adenylate cyclase